MFVRIVVERFTLFFSLELIQLKAAHFKYNIINLNENILLTNQDYSMYLKYIEAFAGEPEKRGEAKQFLKR